MLMTDWYVFDGFNSLKKKNSSYYNINDAYVFMLPSRWQGLVTVKKDNATDEIVFYKYEGSNYRKHDRANEDKGYRPKRTLKSLEAWRL